jgi:hypothetical protein
LPYRFTSNHFRDFVYLFCQRYWKMYHWQSEYVCCTCKMVRDVLGSTYRNRRIGIEGPTARLHRLPDLNPLDVYLWAQLSTSPSYCRCLSDYPQLVDSIGF